MKKTFNLSSIMTNAWKFVKKFGYTMAKALRIAWVNAKNILRAMINSNVNEEVHTHSAWKFFGREVAHGTHSLFQVVVIDPSTNSGSRMLSYFGLSQTNPLEV